MSRRNGDRARFQKDRKRKMRRRQRTKALLAAARPPAANDAEREGQAVEPKPGPKRPRGEDVKAV
jgi:hypothetical protein